jgi:hypothetical protein
MSQPRKCPRCASIQSNRSHRKSLERLLLVLKPYRCANCRHRFFALAVSHRLTH